MLGAACVDPLQNLHHVDPLQHPLFSSGLAAATNSRGAYASAFGGLAALCTDDDDEDERDQQPDRADDDASTDGLQLDTPTAPVRSSSAPPVATLDDEVVAPVGITWTRPSAIQVARQKAAEPREREQRGGEEPRTRAQHRATPYGPRPKTSRGTASAHTSPAVVKRTLGSSDGTVSIHDESAMDTTTSVSAISSSSGYGAMRSRNRNRRPQPVQQSGVRSRMSVRTPAELAAERSEAASAGETTMLLHMWKM